MALQPLYMYRDYKKYLEDRILENEEVRGYKSSLADAAQCQRSFMSQVLNSHIHLTPEHAIGLAQFWSMDANETDYFLALVNHGRAATPALREHLHKSLKVFSERQKDSAMITKNPTLSEVENQSVYYSTWYWSAMHLLVQVPGYQNENALAERLELSLDVVRHSLMILEGMGLVQKKGESWVSSGKNLHAPTESIYSWLHHGSWRTKASENMRKRRKGALHFTGVYSLSQDDIEKVEALIFELVKNTDTIVAPSKEEDVACLCIDWFPL